MTQSHNHDMFSHSAEKCLELSINGPNVVTCWKAPHISNEREGEREMCALTNICYTRTKNVLLHSEEKRLSCNGDSKGLVLQTLEMVDQSP